MMLTWRVNTVFFAADFLNPESTSSERNMIGGKANPAGCTFFPESVSVIGTGRCVGELQRAWLIDTKSRQDPAGELSMPRAEMPSSVVIFATSIFASMKRLFRPDNATKMASVELWVVITTLLLVVRYLIDSLGGPSYSSKYMIATSQIISLLNYSMVHYTLGLMQLSAERVNEYFQVWAVLMVTLQYSVKISCPYSRSKQIPLLDLMSSFWTANLLRVQTTFLKIPLWLIWALNAARIISYFLSSDRAETSNQENTRLVSDYMRYEHTHSEAGADPTTMRGYSYLVHGEDLLLRELQQQRRTGPEKTKRLVFDSILQGSKYYERAFRITEMELSFLQDLFYSRYAAIFAEGFPFLRMLFSLLLISAVGYVAYPVRHIPQRMDLADKNRITHGVFITRFIIGLIITKELWEIYIYAFAPWSKVQMMCLYVKHRCLRNLLVEKAIRLLFCLITRGKWNRKIYQYNLLLADSQGIRLRRGFVSVTSIKLSAEAQKAIFDLFKRLEKDNNSIQSYISNAFVSNTSNVGWFANLTWSVDKLEADTHRILVWHIATCLCEINLAKEMNVFWLRSRPLVSKSRVPKDAWEHYITAVSLSNYCAYLLTMTLVPDTGLAAHRVLTEVRRETYRATRRVKTLEDIYDQLVMIVKNSVEDPAARAPREETPPVDTAYGIMVEEQVIQDEANEDPEEQNSTSNNIRVIDEEHDEQPPEVPEGDAGFDNTIIKMGAELGMQLMEAYKEPACLWQELAKFWAGFLLHLAASTGAAKHKTHLDGNQELITHLWALLSHAGYLGDVSHGEQILES
ncbi:uncharacterized protein LOC121055686 [Oryza brachyantha]|uniref:uncharacterized protein LOC121055686 n=1 Tax=Oryza brachyantha TaxID=4533 RepID=UPI001ADB4B93|nr:uncharacterized protein LOC121055686 [Oryza brachyantha]